jgi:integrase
MVTSMEFTVKLNSRTSIICKNRVSRLQSQPKQEQQSSSSSPRQIVLENNKTVSKYIRGVEVTSKNTAKEYLKRLTNFQGFVSQKYDLTLDEVITTLTIKGKGPKIDVYDLLSEYVSCILQLKNTSPLTLKLRVSTVRNFLETFDVEISLRKFQFKVKMPRAVRAHKEALTKADIKHILNACSDIKLKTYLLFLCASGCRAAEPLSIRHRDLDFESNPPIAFIRGEHTKTKADRPIMLTDELAQQLKLWLDYKQRTRTIGHYDKNNRKTYHEKRTPNIDKEMLLFSERRNKHTTKDESATIDGLYTTMLATFEQLLDRLGGKYSELENAQNRRRRYTFHSIRRMVKSVISDLGLEQFSEIYIGHHSKSTYYRVSQADRIKLFRRIEPYLSYLNYNALETRSNDLETKNERLEFEVRELRENIHRVMEMIGENPKLARVKPEVLIKKSKK